MNVWTDLPAGAFHNVQETNEEMIIIRFCVVFCIVQIILFFFQALSGLKLGFSLSDVALKTTSAALWVTMFDITHSFISVCMSTDVKTCVCFEKY